MQFRTGNNEDQHGSSKPDCNSAGNDSGAKNIGVFTGLISSCFKNMIPPEKGGINAKPSNKSGGKQVLPGTTECGKVQRIALDESRSC